MKRVRLVARFLVGTAVAVGLFWWGTSRLTKEADEDRRQSHERRP